MSDENEDSSIVGYIEGLIDQLEDHCDSDDLSIEELRRMTKGIPPDALQGSSFLHLVCSNEKVTLEIMTYLLEYCPRAMNACADYVSDEVLSAYPLHLACLNESCPNEVIQLLLRNEQDQLFHICHIGFDYGDTGIELLEGQYNGGTPLHFYLSRTTNLDINIVKQLVINQEMLLLTDEGSKYTPIHILMNNKGIGDMSDIVKYLVESNPESINMQDDYDQTPFDMACRNESITTSTIELLLGACPSSVHQRNSSNKLPIHSLCDGNMYAEKDEIQMDEVAIEILKLLLKAHPDSVSLTEGSGGLPLHIAAMFKSQGFCKILVDAYPEAVKRLDDDGRLPFHTACGNGRPETVEYLYRLYPESQHVRSSNGYLPIHCAASIPGENTPKVIEFLLHHDPECLSKPVVSPYDGYLPLHLVFCSNYQADNNVAELLFDLYPEAILIRNRDQQLPFDILRKRDDELPINPETGKPYDEELRLRNRRLLAFLSTQMNYARKAQAETAMRAFDSNGSLPLHRAIRDNAPLGAIKLLLKGNPSAIDVPMVLSEMYPLDIACQFSTLGVVKYLVELSPDRLNPCGFSRNYSLHHACRGGNCEIISYLLETPMSSASVSERNSDGMLPIHLFCEFVSKQEEEDTPEYTETIWRLLTTYPETVLNW